MATTASLEIVGALAIFLLEKTGDVCGKFDGRLSAAEQRAAFGCVPFGKCRVIISGNPETVTHCRTVCFGQDFENITLSWAELEQRCRAGAHPFKSMAYTLPL